MIMIETKINDVVEPMINWGLSRKPPTTLGPSHSSLVPMELQFHQESWQMMVVELTAQLHNNITILPPID